MSFKRAIMHIHTKHSFDCMTSPGKIVDLASRLKIDYLVITDHDSLAGSIDAAIYAASQGLAMQVPIAAEYTTDVGDIIVVGVPPDFQREKDHTVLCRKAKELGAYTVMPHPFKGHRLDKVNFDLIDCIEVYNSRCTINENLNALELAQKWGKPMVYGADAHTLADVENAIFVYQGTQPFDGQTAPVKLLPTSWQRVEFSRFVRGIKLRKPKEALRAIKRGLLSAIKQLCGRHEEI
jgi:predicted metal-dependent phosphoesterase TrpH